MTNLPPHAMGTYMTNLLLHGVGISLCAHGVGITVDTQAGVQRQREGGKRRERGGKEKGEREREEKRGRENQYRTEKLNQGLKEWQAEVPTRKFLRERREGRSTLDGCMRVRVMKDYSKGIRTCLCTHAL